MYFFQYYLSKFLDTDWLNIARRGASNLWIFYQIEELVRYKNNYKDLNYEHIQIIVCCTEWGREYSENWKWHPMDPGQDPKPPVMQNFDILNYCRPYLDELDADILFTHNFLYLFICEIELKVMCCEHFIISSNSESLNAGE